MNPFARCPFDPAGRVVARRPLTVGARTYEYGQELAAADREQLAPRLGMFYDQGLIDTPPRESAPQSKHPQQQRR